MAVPTHTKYTKIADLKKELSSLYTKLTSINDDKFMNLVQQFMYDPMSTPVHTPNLADNAADLTVASVQATPNTYKSTVSHFQNLLKDALECQIEPNLIGDDSSMDNNSKMNGLLKFVRGHTAAIQANTVKVTGQDKVSHNIISSMNLINTFLEILESYANYISDEKDNSIHEINNIFIVNVDPVSDKRYKYLKAASDNSQLKPAFTALYLKMNPVNYTSLVADSTMEVDTKYDGYSNIKASANKYSISNVVFSGSDTLSLNNPTEPTIGYVRGLRIRKNGSDSIIDEMTTARTEMIITPEPLIFENNKQFNASQSATPFFGPNLKTRDQYLLKHFLNIIINIKKESRYTTIKILQMYYTTMKILLLTAVNTGNHLYNSKFASSPSVLHTSASASLFGLKGIDDDNFSVLTIYTSDDINANAAFRINTAYTDIDTQDDVFHTKINNLIDKITADSANSIGVSTTMPTLSDGFYAKKIDDKHIEISSIAITAATSYTFTLADWKHENSFKKNQITDQAMLKEFDNKQINNIKNKYKININGGRYNIVEIYDDIATMLKYKIKASLSDPNLYPKASGALDRTKYNILDYNGTTHSLSTDQNIHKANFAIFKKAAGVQIVNKVELKETTPQDNAEEYNNLKSEIMGYSENIKLNKSKINNYTTLYDLHKSRHNLLNNQLIAYYIIIAVLIGIIVTINLANIEKSFIKTIATGCFAAVVLLFISYYVMNVIYINEEFTVEHFASAFTLAETTTITIEYQDPSKNAKKAFVEGRMNNYCEAIILALKILKPSLENSSLINSSSELLRIGKNESDQRLYINNILINKRDKSEINIDVLKYENMNFAVHIKALLVTALILIGVYTIHLYIEPKYLDLLLFVSAILLISVFTYFIVYSNKIVRTTSSNNYWGKEYENQYGII